MMDNSGFTHRHLGPRAKQIEQMLEAIGAPDMDTLIDETVPQQIRMQGALKLPPAFTEREALHHLKTMGKKNQVHRSYIGAGYHGTLTPSVILRNLLENPGWYTAYTPYQAEISQGRLEALLCFQTMVQDLTGMEIANASMLDEPTAAAEAMTMSHRIGRGKRNTFMVSHLCHPQTISVVQTRAQPLGIRVVVGDHETFFQDPDDVFGVLVQYPDTNGKVNDYASLCTTAHEHKALVTVAADLLSLTLLRSPAGFGADIVVGNSQRFGVPMGFGGPHAAFMATTSAHRRQLPGRIIGISVDVHGNPALRMALQTREQHIRRQKATSNICTAQVLLAVIAAMYAVWHGPEGLTQIARRIRNQAEALRAAILRSGHSVQPGPIFDTVCVTCPDEASRDAIMTRALAAEINLRPMGATQIAIALDETVSDDDLIALAALWGTNIEATPSANLPEGLARVTPFLTNKRFNRFHSETEMLRYLHQLEAKDITLNASMIPLGSCTMKLNAASEMIPVTWEEFGGLHPFVPNDQSLGYRALIADLENWLGEITGFDAISLQPNAGSQGEYAGLLSIHAFHESNGEPHRNICLIPTSAHGTNPASAVMAGMKVVTVDCDQDGNINVVDLRAKSAKYSDTLGALMVTYPSTHGVFEADIKEVCAIIHEHGGQVYMDGANMNAMVGLCRPADIGADVCHLNLHKTFAIPHGGGGPGMGPIGVKAHLAPYLPNHPLVQTGGEKAMGTISAAPWGSASILPISWAYIRMLGPEGLKKSSEVAILNANYIATRLSGHYEVLYKGANGRVAHECILDCRQFKKYGVEVVDVAKRLMDFGFHAPTMSFPVAGTLMVEPTESESLEEINRFCEAMIAIRSEIQAVIDGQLRIEDSALRGAPHTAMVVTANDWERPYSRQEAAFPSEFTQKFKVWPPVGRIDDAYGDRNLFCSCDAWPEEPESS